MNGWLQDDGHHSLAGRTAGMAFLIRVASAALTYVSQIALVRWMGATEFGIFIYVWTWTLLIGAFADAGLGSAAQRFIPAYGERKSFALLRGFIAGSRVLALGLATLLALVGALAITLLRPVLDEYVVIPLYIACFCLPIYALSNVQDGIARCYNWVHIGLTPAYIIRPVLLLVLMGIAYLLGFARDADTAIAASVISFWLVTLVQTVLINRSLAPIVPQGRKTYAWKVWITTALPIVMVIGFYMLLTYIDIIIVQYYRTPVEVAQYHAASKTLALVAFVYFAVSAATAHRFSEYHTAGDIARLENFLASAVRWTFWPSIVIAALVLALGKPLLWLFGPTFTEAYPTMVVLAIGLIARASVGPAERLLSMLGEQRLCAAVYALAFTFNLVACIVLVPRYGGVGAAAATTVALILESVLLFTVVRRRLGFHAFIVGGALKPKPAAKPAKAAPAKRTPAPRLDSQFDVEWQPIERLAQVRGEWTALAEQAIEPNIFYEPSFALAAVPEFGGGVMVALVRTREDRRLVAMFPFRRRNLFGDKFVGWTHPFAPLGVPLVDRDCAVPAIAAFLDHLAGQTQRPKLLLWPYIDEAGAFAAAFRVAAEHRAQFVSLDRHVRAQLGPAAPRDGYFERTISGKRRKEWRRQRRRLSEQAPVSFELAGTPAAIALALRDFFVLEAKGWKGEAGTAAAQRAGTKKFMQDSVLALSHDGQAMIGTLRQGNRTLAAGIVLRSGDTAWYWKVAYDQTAAQSSPGVHFTVDLSNELLRNPEISVVDSCATPDHSMIDRVWSERRAMADLLVGVEPGGSFAAAHALESLRRAAIRTAKRAREFLR